jgi:glutamate synthase (NADPH/NADH) large chain/glutamate synthase (ferredoxin)
MLFPVAEGPKGLAPALERLCHQASEAIKAGYNFIILSDRGVNTEWAPIPSLLSVSCLHHYLNRES